MQASTVAVPVRPVRLIAFRGVGLLLAVVTGVLFGGLIAAAAGWFYGEHGGSHRVHVTAWGATMGILTTLALLAQVRSPKRGASALFQLGGVAVAFLIAGALGRDVGGSVQLGATMLAGVAVLVALHPERSVLAEPGSPSAVMLALTAVAVPFAVRFAVSAAALQRAAHPGDPHAADHHWVGMAVMALAIVIVALVASLRLRGFRFSGYAAAGAAALAGVAFVAFPGLPSSAGAAWGAATLAWAGAFAAATARAGEPRRA